MSITNSLSSYRWGYEPYGMTGSPKDKMKLFLEEVESDVNVLTSDLKVVSDAVVGDVSDMVLVSDALVAGLSDLKLVSDALVGDISDMVVVSDAVAAQLSGMRVAISDAIVAAGAGDWANVSDIKVSVTELLAAFSDALA